MSESQEDTVDRSGAMCYSSRCLETPTHRIQFSGGDRWYGICEGCADGTPVHHATVLEGLTPETITAHPVESDRDGYDPTDDTWAGVLAEMAIAKSGLEQPFGGDEWPQRSGYEIRHEIYRSTKDAIKRPLPERDEHGDQDE